MRTTLKAVIEKEFAKMKRQQDEAIEQAWKTVLKRFPQEDPVGNLKLKALHDFKLMDREARIEFELPAGSLHRLVAHSNGTWTVETNGAEATLPDGWEFKHVANALLRHSGLDETSAQAWIAQLSPMPADERADPDESDAESD